MSRETHSLPVLILTLAATTSMLLSACAGASIPGQTEPDSQGGLSDGGVHFTMTPAPKTGMFVVGPAFYVSAPQRLSGSYRVMVYSLDCGPGGNTPENLTHLSLFHAGSNGSGQSLYRFGGSQDPTDLPSGDYVVAYNNPPSVYSCWFDIGLTPE